MSCFTVAHSLLLWLRAADTDPVKQEATEGENRRERRRVRRERRSTGVVQLSGEDDGDASEDALSDNTA